MVLDEDLKAEIVALRVIERELDGLPVDRAIAVLLSVVTELIDYCSAPAEMWAFVADGVEAQRRRARQRPVPPAVRRVQ